MSPLSKDDDILHTIPIAQPTTSMRASLIESDMDKIRAIIREELQRQEGFLRALVQEEFEAQHDAYYAHNNAVQSDIRRFIVTYRQEAHSMEIGGVEFSSLLDKPVVLELYPYSESNSPRVFRNVADMEFHLNEFGDTSIKWLDEEVKP